MTNRADDLLQMAVDIAKAEIEAGKVEADGVQELIRGTFNTLRELDELQRRGSAASGAAGQPEIVKGKRRVEEGPIVPIQESVKDDHIVCLEDGKKLRMLKRYLKTQFDMSPDEYRSKWGLPAEYPMTCPALAESRSGIAKDRGLGTKKSNPKNAD
jgi:predicted transcriptional regulator